MKMLTYQAAYSSNILLLSGTAMQSTAIVLSYEERTARRIYMGGVLYFDDTKPIVGAKLIILVNRVNKPAGVWRGELIAVEDNDRAVYPHPDFLHNTREAYCTAKITDSQAPEEFAGQEPVVNYCAYMATSGTHYFLKRLDDANAEIRGLKRRIEIERSSWHAMMKAIVNPEAFPKLQRLLEEFLTKLGRS